MLRRSLIFLHRWLGVALCFVYFGYVNFLRGFSSYRMPSMTPIASLYIAIPISGALMVLFIIEQMVNGWRNGFDHPELPEDLYTVQPVDPLLRGERS